MGIKDILNKLRNSEKELDENVRNDIVKTIVQIKEDLQDRVDEINQSYKSIVFNVDEELIALKCIAKNLEKNGFKVTLGDVDKDISPTLREYYEAEIKIEFKNSNDKDFKNKINQVLDLYNQEVEALNKKKQMAI